jgi:hypothetical protein
VAEGERSEGRGGGREVRTKHPQPRAAGGAERDQREPGLRGEPKDADGRFEVPVTRRGALGAASGSPARRTRARTAKERPRALPAHEPRGIPWPTTKLSHAGLAAADREVGAGHFPSTSRIRFCTRKSCSSCKAFSRAAPASGIWMPSKAVTAASRSSKSPSVRTRTNGVTNSGSG